MYVTNKWIIEKNVTKLDKTCYLLQPVEQPGI